MNEIDDIKSRVDIVELLSSYINLKKAGRNYKAVCPFHKEKTPSFMVSPDKQIWHCFGCNKGGDIFRFVMDMEGMDFGESLRLLAKRAGVILTEKSFNPQVSNKKNILIEINNLAASFYHKFLEDSTEAKVARDYLDKRQLKKETIMEFRLGYAPKAFNKLTIFLQNKGYNHEDIIKSGLAVKKDNGEVADRFYGRLMFPILNPAGSVLGFTGRILTDEKTAKYINTPETLIYEKSRVLFGLDKAKKSIIEKRWVVIVEGNMDVISSFQAGVKNAVASSGTALTKEQFKVLKRYTSNLIFAMDKDEAGKEALKRAIFLALDEEMNIKITDLGEFKDPDEMIKKDDFLWKKTLKNSKPFLDFYFDNLFDKIDKSDQDVTYKKRVASEILPFLKRMQNSIEQSHYVQKLAHKLEVPESSINDALKKVKTDKNINQIKREDTSYKQKKTTKEILEETVLGIMIAFPSFVDEIIMLLDEKDFSNESSKALFKDFKEIVKRNEKFNFEEFDNPGLKTLAKELAFITEEKHKDSDNNDIFKEAKFCYKRIKQMEIDEQKLEINRKISEAGKDHKSVEKLIQKLQDILNKEKEIKEF